MGFDIYAYPSEKDSRTKKEIAYLRCYMGAFRMCCEQGYDWFELIDARECDGGVSGTGMGKYIELINLLDALNKLETHDTKGVLAEGYGLEKERDEWTDRKPILKEFMVKCIDWCKTNDATEIYIYFG